MTPRPGNPRRLRWTTPIREVLAHAVLLGMVLVSGTALIGVLLALYLQMVLTTSAAAMLAPGRSVLGMVGQAVIRIILCAVPVLSVTLLHSLLLADAMGHAVVGWQRWQETDLWVAAWSTLWVAFHALLIVLFARDGHGGLRAALPVVFRQGGISLVALIVALLGMLLLLLLQQIGFNPLYWLWRIFPAFGLEGLVAILLTLLRLALALAVADDREGGPANRRSE